MADKLVGMSSLMTVQIYSKSESKKLRKVSQMLSWRQRLLKVGVLIQRRKMARPTALSVLDLLFHV